MTVNEWAAQSRYSDPGPYAALLDTLPTDVHALGVVVRNLLVHYRAGGVELPAERLAEIDLRWVDRILAADRARNGDTPLAVSRAAVERVAGCCRDFTLLTVAALRHRGTPARSRVGFAGYFEPGFHNDHVVVEYWDGARWVLTDAQLDPAVGWEFDTSDMPRDDEAVFWTAARTWTAVRRGEVDPELFGVDPGLPIRGAWLVRDYVLQELAHRRRDELLLWDGWGVMSTAGGADPDADALVDEVAALLLAADDGDADAERELAVRYRDDARLRPDGKVLSFSPTGRRTWVDLDARRETAPPVDARTGGPLAAAMTHPWA